LAAARSTVFFILIGASVFTLMFRGFGGDALIESVFENMPGGAFGATVIVMLVIFLGFILDFIEITFVVVAVVAPALLPMGLDPVWLGIMIAIKLQTSLRHHPSASRSSTCAVRTVKHPDAGYPFYRHAADPAVGDRRMARYRHLAARSPLRLRAVDHRTGRLSSVT
jgi:hypothetical protein